MRVWDGKKGDTHDINPYRRVRCIKVCRSPFLIPTIYFPLIPLLLSHLFQKLKGEGRSLTCIQLARMEVIAGTVDGKVLVWWIQTGEIMKTIKV